ncbi:hypothetical protein D9758_011594 [Tetrapyrgos nigripes]|uniref:Uncharacterized protein n=1 Tax=Tetrapyrgos nigripes TaxID=182062 RepID=A0A8H5CP95_9AGAR|nr:hypothetical protein D9758_011594 [Tetrapyrgos nigripes]
MTHRPLLPPELWTHIWSFACTDDGTTGRTLSRVSQYVYATSAPVRLQSITLTGLHDLLAFAYMIRTSPEADRLLLRVRYLTVMADPMPVSLQELEKEIELRDRLIALNRTSSITHNTPSLPITTEERQAAEKKRERFFLHTLFNLLRLLSPVLLELELSLQAIKSPNFLSHVGCPSSVWPHPHPHYSIHQNFGPLEFPRLSYLFYACPPSGAFLWTPTTPPRVSQPLAEVNLPLETSSNSDVLSEQESYVPFVCPWLKELTIVCDDSEAGDPDDETVAEEEEQEERVDEMQRLPREEEEDNSGTSNKGPDADPDSAPTALPSESSPLVTLAPSLRNLTLLASSPAQAITAMYSASCIADSDSSAFSLLSTSRSIQAELDLAAAAAEWEAIYMTTGYGYHDVTSSESSTSPFSSSELHCSALESAVDGAALARVNKGLPESVEQVLCAPRARWDQSWDAFKTGIKKGLAQKRKMEAEAEAEGEPQANSEAEEEEHGPRICVVNRSELP